jgi:iron complex transport system ATP-binding protein
VLFDGVPVAGLGPRERARRLAVVPQGLATLPDLTVKDFVGGGRYAHVSRWSGPQPADARAVEQALAAADCGDIAGRRLGELSGGQRQRVLVARALAQEAPYLLVDEPTAALDFEHQVRIVSLLAELVRGGRAALVATHDVNLASQFAHRVALLAAGRLVICGPPAQVLRREVLEPIYGPHLHVGAMPAPDGRPFVLPWLPLSR